MTIARIEPQRAFFYDGNRMIGWDKDDGPFWHGNGSSVEERLYEAIEGMAELHARLAVQEAKIADGWVRLPEPDTPEEAEAVERMALGITGDNARNCCHLGGWKYPEVRYRPDPSGQDRPQAYGGDRCECRVYAIAALRALRPAPEEKPDA